MAIQILGLREYFDSRKNKTAKKEVFFENGWRANSVAEILANPDHFVAQIPESERYNLYYTVGSCFEEPGRKIEEQTVIPFDVDGINVEKAEAVARVVVEALGLDWHKTGVVFSGNGVQILVDQPNLVITSDDVFEEKRIQYKACCARISLALMDAGLDGKTDTSVWSPARLMRLPGTLNRKPNKPERMAVVLQSKLEKQDFDMKRASGLVDVAPRDQIAESIVKRLPTPDTDAILSECEFLKWSKENQNDVTEHQWYAGLSILRRLRDGEVLVHEYSKEYRGYSHGETELKAEQALTNSGPRTCKNIEAMWEGCKGCKHYNSEKVKSPIMIQGPDYITTEKSGFHSTVTDANGNPRPGKPQIEDLRRYFQREHKYVTLEDSRIVYVYNGTHWVEIPDAQLESFAYEKFAPKVGSGTRQEFVSAVQCTNLKGGDWFGGSTDRRVNFKNGVYCIDDGTFEPHSPSYGFRYVLPYNYDATAECPNFDKFLSDITCDRKALADVLLEYMGYCFSGDEIWLHQALMLIGVGRNGKSTFMQVMEKLAGEGTYSTVTLTEMKQETMRQQLDGRLFNMAEETSPSALSDSSVFKNLVGGGKILVKKLYKQPYVIKNKAKLVFSCNELPLSKDKTDALYRRMLIVPFDNKFDAGRGNVDPLIARKLEAELPGIFNRVLEGYKRLLKQGHFTNSDELKKQIEIYEEENDAVLSFFHEEIIVEAFDKDNKKAHRTSMQEIYQSYKNYAEHAYGEKPLTSPKFFHLLKKRIADYEGRVARETINGVRDRRLIGVKLAKGRSDY